eukprot:TRINITY_DN456_c0_g2_i5.p1 TRINITY_DN456_c0_g2~~TRINITY_DN456_c0_g2_i5.p1  ORF type:complete len:1038 (-),score=164.96 TRINITY_DN456_c0_g2_i5:71-3184(-)
MPENFQTYCEPECERRTATATFLPHHRFHTPLPLQEELTPLTIALAPKCSFPDQHSNPSQEIDVSSSSRHVSFMDNVVQRVVVEVVDSPLTGAMIVEDVELDLWEGEEDEGAATQGDGKGKEDSSYNMQVKIDDRLPCPLSVPLHTRIMVKEAVRSDVFSEEQASEIEGGGEEQEEVPEKKKEGEDGTKRKQTSYNPPPILPAHEYDSEDPHTHIHTKWKHTSYSPLPTSSLQTEIIHIGFKKRQDREEEEAKGSGQHPQQKRQNSNFASESDEAFTPQSQPAAPRLSHAALDSLLPSTHLGLESVHKDEQKKEMLTFSAENSSQAPQSPIKPQSQHSTVHFSHRDSDTPLPSANLGSPSPRAVKQETDIGATSVESLSQAPQTHSKPQSLQQLFQLSDPRLSQKTLNVATPPAPSVVSAASELVTRRPAGIAVNGRALGTVFRRRLRFQRLPNLIQSEVPLVFVPTEKQHCLSEKKLQQLLPFQQQSQLQQPKQQMQEEQEVQEQQEQQQQQQQQYLTQEQQQQQQQQQLETLLPQIDTSLAQTATWQNGIRRVDYGELVHKYLSPIVAGLALIEGALREYIADGGTPRAIIIGGGACTLPIFLRKHFPFSIDVVEIDQVVIDVARRHFGLREDHMLRVHIAEGKDFVMNFARMCTNHSSPSKQGTPGHNLTREAKRKAMDAKLNTSLTEDAWVVPQGQDLDKSVASPKSKPRLDNEESCKYHLEDPPTGAKFGLEGANATVTLEKTDDSPHPMARISRLPLHENTSAEGTSSCSKAIGTLLLPDNIIESLVQPLCSSRQGVFHKTDTCQQAIQYPLQPAPSPKSPSSRSEGSLEEYLSESSSEEIALSSSSQCTSYRSDTSSGGLSPSLSSFGTSFQGGVEMGGTPTDCFAREDPKAEDLEGFGDQFVQDAQVCLRCKVHFLVLDVDVSDGKLCLSSPPKAFLRKDFLSAIRRLLHPQGLFAINVVPYSVNAYRRVVDLVKKYFGELYEANVDDDINYVMYALPGLASSRNSREREQGMLRGVKFDYFLSRMQKL